MTAPTRSPSVAVLLATHQGERFVAEQLESILGQSGVDLTVLVSDDASSDGTLDVVAGFAERDDRVRILAGGEFGGAAPNFYRLLDDVDIDAFDYVGFADQDDVWMPDKLERHVAILERDGSDGVSSNVTAFDAQGNRTLIRKDYPQRLADHLFETPGPGSTYLMTRRLVGLVQEQLRNPRSPAREAEAHDWLVYALARSAGLRWTIDGESTVEYRQHEANAVGANTGIGQAVRRVRLSAGGWHRREVQVTVEACIHVASEVELPRLQWFHAMLRHRTPGNTARIARRADQLRRRPRDRAVLAALMVSGMW